jgi:hypothetical protein
VVTDLIADSVMAAAFPRRVRIQPTAIGSAGSIAIRHRPNSLLRAVVYPDLPQDWSLSSGGAG